MQRLKIGAAANVAEPQVDADKHGGLSWVGQMKSNSNNG